MESEHHSNHATNLAAALKYANELLGKGRSRWHAIEKAGTQFQLSPKDQLWLENEIPKTPAPPVDKK